MSLPSTAKANSSTITSAIEEIPNLSDLNLDITPRSLFNSTEESLTPKRNILRDVSEEEAKHNHEFKVNKPDLDEFTEIQFTNEKNLIVKHENRRRSISDLVERYKKLLEVSNSATAKFQTQCAEYKIE